MIIIISIAILLLLFAGWYMGQMDYDKIVDVNLVIINSQKNTIMANTKIQVAQNLAAILGLVDTVTGQPVAAEFSDVSFSSDNTEVMTTEQNAENANEQDITGVAAGTANLLVTATAAYNDSNNEPQTKTLTAAIPVTVAAAADGVALNVTFGVATPAPAPAATEATAPAATPEAEGTTEQAAS
jgi:hypothetical protein